MPDAFRTLRDRPYARYGLAVAVVAASFLLRVILVQGLGLEMPAFITFTPAIVLVAILGGFWPGILATGLLAIGADYLVFAPIGSLSIVRPSDAAALAFFALMGVLISWLAEYRRRAQRSLAAYREEQTLWLMNAKLELAMASMSDAVFIADADGKMVNFNDAFATLHGFGNKAEVPRSPAKFRELVELLTSEGEVVPLEKWNIRRALRGESGSNVEYMLRRKDTGLTRTVSYNFSPLRDSNGAIVGAVAVGRDITDQKIAEQKLRESERESSLIYKNMHDVLFYLAVEPGDQFRFISVNPAFYRATGLDAAQVLGRLVREVIPEPSSRTVQEKYKEAVREGKTISWEETTVYPAGEKIAAVVVSPVINERGECTNLIGVLHDITERRRAEEHIHQLNRVYSVLSDINQTIVRERDSRTMLESACRIAVDKGKFRMAWVGMIDPSTKILEPITSSGVVDGYLDQLKIDVQDTHTFYGPAARSIVTGKHATCDDIEHDPLYLPWRSEAMRRGYRSSGAFPLKVDGEVIGVFSIYASEAGFFVEDELVLLDEMAMDISFALEVNRREEQRTKAEEELRSRTAFFEAQVDSAMDGVLVVDANGKIVLQNHRVYQLFKIPPDLAGNTDDAMQVEFVRAKVKDGEQFEEKIRYLYSHPEEVSLDEVELTDGTILERSSSPVRDRAQKYYGRIWNFRDITERRQLEEQFRQAQKMEAVGQLTGGIAHDFNNLLTVILGCSEVLSGEVQGNSRLGKMAEMIQEAAQRGAELTHRMLAFARRQTLQPRPVDVNRLLANMSTFLRRTLSADIELEVVECGEECIATADLTQLESAILNLCVNARDAMPGGGKLTIETGHAELSAEYAVHNPEVIPGQYILVAVSDTGCGIIPENLGRVFDPFFTTKEVGKGTGLGLSMVYGFVKQSRGHVRIYSEPSQGTSVKLYLPQANQKDEAAGNDQAPIVDLRGSEVVLLAEDNEPVREFAKSQLLDLGYRVLEAANGKDALKIVAERADIDLLFTDVVMPGGMTGRDLAVEACKLNPRLKVLYTSGYAENAMVHQGLLDNGVNLLTKPYTRLEMARRIRQVLAAT